jgi:hypothetical protein
MGIFSDRRVILACGAAGAVALGMGAAVLVIVRAPAPKGPPPASKGGLVVEQGPSDATLDPARPLRCFVGGQMVGTMTLAECAKRNGVATRALDLGVDATGALAAASDSGPVVQTLTPRQAPEAAPAAQAAAAPTAPCWRREVDWRRLPSDLSLNACVQALYAGHCVKPGEAAYGRWGQETLRLVMRRVEISADNRAFRLLVEQDANCATPQIPG